MTHLQSILSRYTKYIRLIFWKDSQDASESTWLREHKRYTIKAKSLLNMKANSLNAYQHIDGTLFINHLYPTRN